MIDPQRESDVEFDTLADCDDLRQSYSELPIGSSVDWATHPDALATFGILHGLQPAPVTNCRVLELGCACGGNLVPLAHGLPQSQCLGVDISEVQIAKARKLAEQLDVPNVELRAANIFDLDESIGEFDYIICDGVFSWVPSAVQDKILQLCSRHLAENGLAYISFNACPGWRVRGIVRDMLRTHTRNEHDVRAKVEAARTFLRELEKVAENPRSPLGLIRAELENLRTSRDSYLYHEHLVEHNTQYYLREFVDRATANSLAFVTDLHPMDGDFEQFQSGFARAGGDINNHLELLQYIDYLENRQYHCALLCRDNQRYDWRPNAERTRALLIGSPFRPHADNPDICSAKPEEFVGPEANMTSGHPFVKAMLTALSRCWPNAISFTELWDLVCEELTAGPEPFPLDFESDEVVLTESILHCHSRGLVSLRTHQPELSTTVVEKPLASPVARCQAKTDAEVANLLHTVVALTPLERQILQCLDGTRSQSAIADELRGSSQQENTTGDDGGTLEQSLKKALTRFAEKALLLPPIE